jgi:uncharacterized protein
VKPRISVLSIGVADLARSRRFYEEGMGLKPRPESSERAVFFELEWSWLSLFQRDRLADLARVSAEGSGFQGFVFSHNVASAEEVDAVMAQAVAAGASVPRPAEDGDFGRIGYFADPDGFLWEVAYTPRWPELTA